MKPALYLALAVLTLGLLPPDRAMGQTDSRDVTINAIGDSNSATFQTGIASDAEITGITVINGEVWIDGQKVPPGVTRFTSRSGKSYRIQRDGANVQVRDE